MNEQELIEQLKIAEEELKLARQRLTVAKKEWTDAETVVINTKIHLECLTESLRKLRACTPKYEINTRDQDIEQFRKDYPELVDLAKQRDLNKE